MLYFDRFTSGHFGTNREQIWCLSHFALHTALLLALQGVAMLMLWLVALQGLKIGDERFHDVQSKTYAHAYGNSTDVLLDLNNKMDTAIWGRVPKGLDVSEGRKNFSETLMTLGSSYDFLNLNQTNHTAASHLEEAFKRAETIAIQTLFTSLSVSIPTEEDAENTGSAQFDKDKLLDKYEERFTLVFNYVYISGGAALIIIAVI